MGIGNGAVSTLLQWRSLDEFGADEWDLFGWHPLRGAHGSRVRARYTRKHEYCISMWMGGCQDTPKLRNINLHNITHSLISQNSREQTFVVQISFLIVTFLSLISQNLSLTQTTKEVNPHPRIVPCVNMWSVICWIWCIHNTYVTSSGKVKWSGPHQQRWEENEFKFHSVTCYTNSILSRIHVNTTKSVISRALWLPRVWYYIVLSVFTHSFGVGHVFKVNIVIG